MSEFEKAFNQLGKVGLENHTELWGEPKTERAFFEAGQASKQAEIDGLKTQLNNMEQCYIQAKKERDELNQWNNNQYELIKRNESQTQSLRHLLQKLIDDSYTTMRPSMAYEIQEALRGEHETD